MHTYIVCYTLLPLHQVRARRALFHRRRPSFREYQGCLRGTPHTFLSFYTIYVYAYVCVYIYSLLYTSSSSPGTCTACTFPSSTSSSSPTSRLPSRHSTHIPFFLYYIGIGIGIHAYIYSLLCTPSFVLGTCTACTFQSSTSSSSPTSRLPSRHSTHIPFFLYYMCMCICMCVYIYSLLYTSSSSSGTCTACTFPSSTSFFSRISRRLSRQSTRASPPTSTS